MTYGTIVKASCQRDIGSLSRCVGFLCIFLFGADFDLRLKDSFFAVFGVFGGYERRRAQRNRPPSGQTPGLWPCWKYRASATGTADKFCCHLLLLLCLRF